MEDTQGDNKPDRRVWEKPRVCRVRLTPEEATLASCKGEGVGGPDDLNACARLQCLVMGS